MKYLLKNGNKPYDLSLHPLCGAKAKHGGTCKAKAMKNGRCRLHGGRTPIKKGRYTNTLLKLRKEIKELTKFIKTLD
ncbi:MAG: hypothetical protein ACI9CD_000928 [Candidatus Deianiraeaceae bacterium]|jgi:hypothetical protein